MQRTRRVRIIKQLGSYANKRFRSQPVPPDVAPVGQCANSTRLYSARSQTWSCACVLREQSKTSINRIAAVRYSKFFFRTRACYAACYHGPVFVVKRVLRRSAASIGAVSTLKLRLCPHLDLFPLGVHSATIRIAHVLCPKHFSNYLAPCHGDL
jgi:hypothetical protein